MSENDGNRERTRLRVKLGNAELEYEGNTQFLKDEVMPAVAKIFQLVELRSDLAAVGVATEIEDAPTVSLPGAAPPPKLAGHTTGSIATLLKAESAGDLAIAAAAYLALVAKQEKFTRQELLAAMRSATGFYKKTDQGNLTKTLQGHVKAGRLREADGGHYVLAPRAREEMEQAIAQNS
jgi:hypothetical protein